MERKSGVLMHISSLWGDYSCGAFSNAAKEFVDFLADCGFSYWQTLPFNPIDEFGSPYKSYSAFAGNINFVDIEELYKKDLITEAELLKSRQTTPYVVEFEKLFKERLDLFKKASERLSGDMRKNIEDFLEKNPHIKEYCEFAALKEANDYLPQHKWTKKTYDPKSFLAYGLSQYEFFAQWRKIKEYANEKSIKIIGDVPIYVSFDSSDVYYNPKQFLLDEKGYPTEVSGVPPDYFSKDGQLWGNPLYDFSYMEKENFKWWQERVEHMFSMFDGIRIDHFRAFESFWAVPADAKTAAEGKWVKGPGMKLLNCLKEIKQGGFIIAEDLGDITSEVRELVKESGFPGMRVFQFGFLSDGDSIHKPHNYPKNTVAYSGTHDNNTLLGYLWELGEEKRKEVLAYCGYNEADWERGYENMLRALLVSAAETVIFPIQDILKYGADTRLNTPGKVGDNWRFRVTKEQILGIRRDYFKNLNKTYGRI